MSELKPDADVSKLMHGEYAGSCESCEGTIHETKDFDGVVLCPMCNAGGGRERVLEKRKQLTGKGANNHG